MIERGKRKVSRTRLVLLGFATRRTICLRTGGINSDREGDDDEWVGRSGGGGREAVVAGLRPCSRQDKDKECISTRHYRKRDLNPSKNSKRASFGLENKERLEGRNRR